MQQTHQGRRSPLPDGDHKKTNVLIAVVRATGEMSAQAQRNLLEQETVQVQVDHAEALS